jgi:hypothetical protein
MTNNADRLSCGVITNISILSEEPREEPRREKSREKQGRSQEKSQALWLAPPRIAYSVKRWNVD